jgi:hypothetical protein
MRELLQISVINAEQTLQADVTGGLYTVADYDQLRNRPSLNGVTLSGNKSAAELGLTPDYAAAEEIQAVIEGQSAAAASETHTPLDLESGVPAIWAKAAETFVAKDGGKVLSDNNYSSAEKAQLAENTARLAGKANAVVREAEGSASTVAAETYAESLSLHNGTVTITHGDGPFEISSVVGDVTGTDYTSGCAIRGATLLIGDSLQEEDTALTVTYSVKTPSYAAIIYPDEGSVLLPTCSIEPLQAGSGNPSLDNIRPILGRETITPVLNGEPLTPIGIAAAAGKKVYAGTVRYTGATSGKLIVSHRLDTAISSWGSQELSSVIRFTLKPSGMLSSGNSNIVCSHFFPVVSFNESYEHIYRSGQYIYLFIKKERLQSYGNAGLQEFVAAQEAAGTPFQMLVPLATPLEYDVTLPPMIAGAGSNTIGSDGGNLRVTYQADIGHLLDSIADAIEALRGDS